MKSRSSVTSATDPAADDPTTIPPGAEWWDPSTGLLKTRNAAGTGWVSSDAAGSQPLDATLTALAALNSGAGLLEQTGADTFTKRAIGVGAASSIPTKADMDAAIAAAIAAIP